MMGRFPEYLKDSSRACRVTKDRAERIAAEFNELTPALHWEAVPETLLTVLGTSEVSRSRYKLRTTQYQARLSGAWRAGSSARKIRGLLSRASKAYLSVCMYVGRMVAGVGSNLPHWIFSPIATHSRSRRICRSIGGTSSVQPAKGCRKPG
jgi:hypothetical protein